MITMRERQYNSINPDVVFDASLENLMRFVHPVRMTK